MRQILVATCFAAIPFVGQQAIAADQAQKAEAAENKAEVLEQNAASGGSKERPSKSETITKPESQAVDPVGNTGGLVPDQIDQDVGIEQISQRPSLSCIEGWSRRSSSSNDANS